MQRKTGRRLRRMRKFKVLGIYPLQQRRLRRDLIEAYKILTGKERVDSQLFFPDGSKSIQSERIFYESLFQDVTKPSGKRYSVSEPVIVGTCCHNVT